MSHEFDLAAVLTAHAQDCPPDVYGPDFVCCHDPDCENWAEGRWGGRIYRHAHRVEGEDA